MDCRRLIKPTGRDFVMSTLRILLLICILSISAQTANAGPSNRNAKQGQSQSNVPVNLDGFGAPLPGVAQDPSDLNIFATTNQLQRNRRAATGRADHEWRVLRRVSFA